jgi:hypothetical protein
MTTVNKSPGVGRWLRSGGYLADQIRKRGLNSFGIIAFWARSGYIHFVKALSNILPGAVRSGFAGLFFWGN